MVPSLTAGMVLSVLFLTRLLGQLDWGRHIRATAYWPGTILVHSMEYNLHGLVACFHDFILRGSVFQRVLIREDVSYEYGK